MADDTETAQIEAERGEIEPGASDVFSHAGGAMLSARTFFATRPAAMRRPGSDVFMQRVMVAIAGAPRGGVSC